MARSATNPLGALEPLLWGIAAGSLVYALLAPDDGGLVTLMAKALIVMVLLVGCGVWLVNRADSHH